MPVEKWCRSDKRRHTVTGDPGALVFWSVCTGSVWGMGAWASLMWAGPLFGGWDLVSASQGPGPGSLLCSGWLPFGSVVGVLSRHAAPAQLVSSASAWAGSCGDPCLLSLWGGHMFVQGTLGLGPSAITGFGGIWGSHLPVIWMSVFVWGGGCQRPRFMINDMLWHDDMRMHVHTQQAAAPLLLYSL